MLDADLAVRLAELDERAEQGGGELGGDRGGAPAWATAPALPDEDPFDEVPAQLRGFRG